VTARTRTAALAATASFVLTASAVPMQAAAAAEPRAAASTSTALACSTQTLPKRAAQAVVVTVSLDGTTARLTGTSGHSYLGVPRLLNARLTLRRPGFTWHATPKAVAGTPGRGVLSSGVFGPAGRLGSLCLARFRDGATPVGLLGLTSAMNQCCYIVKTYSPGVRPRSRLQDGTAATTVRTVNGHALIVTGDGRFLARFADFADSGLPLRLITVRPSGQVNVTRAHPRLLGADARRWRRLFDNRNFGLGFLACWAADQEQLGHDALVWRRLNDLNAQHRLTVPAGLGSYWPHGTAYIKALRTFLVKTGYAD
jgi:hypothetical protein